MIANNISNQTLADVEVFDLIRFMQESLPWFPHCVNKFEVTNVPENYNLLDLFDEDVDVQKN